MDHLEYSREASGEQHPCEHMQELHRQMVAAKMRVGSCGCCDGINLKCIECGVTLRGVMIGYHGDLAHLVYNAAEMTEGYA